MIGLPLTDLRDRVTGDVIEPGHAGYDEARKVFNAMAMAKRPAVVVRAANDDDVVAAVNFARENRLDLAVRGGGHNAAGFGTVDGGLVINLTQMRKVTVDPVKRRAYAQGGATWGDYNNATYEHGLASTGGILSTTGVAGLTLGGGIGYLTRGFGLACDNLVGADVVLADGRKVHASKDENADLFWALRGGSGNFGVVTTFEFQVHPVKDVYWGPMFYDLSDSEAVIKGFTEYIKSAPEQMGGFPAFQIAPPLPFIPEARQGQRHALIVGCWTGPLEQGEKQFKVFHEFAPVVAEMVGPTPYPAINSAFDALYPYGELQNYWKANFIKDLTPAGIAAHVEHGSRVPVLQSTMHLYPINGAVHRVGADETAFAFRDSLYADVIAGMWPDPADNEANIKWVRDYAAATTPHSEAGGYINFMSEDDQGRIRDNFTGNYSRLVEVKRAYDPDNLFHVNQNIKP
jgi:FAD/FMN-containing dehydrogenase